MEVLKSEPPELLKRLEKLMCTQASCCEGLPLAAEGKRQEFYWK